MAKTLRIQSLALRYFIAHQKTDLDLQSGNIFVFSGNFGDGKTAIRDAIDWLLTGSARGLYRKDSARLAYDPTRHGLPPFTDPPKMAVKGSIQFGPDLHEVTRTPTRESHSKTALADLAGVPDLDILDALLEVARFPAYDTEKRLRLIDRVLGSSLTLKDFEGTPVDDIDVQKAALKNLKSGKSKATDKRRSEEGAAEGCVITPPDDEEIPKLKRRLSQVDLPSLEKKIEEYAAARDALLRDIEGSKGRTEGAREAKRDSLVEAGRALLDATTTAEKAREARDSMATGPLSRDAAEAKKRREILAPILAEERESVERVRQAMESARADAEKASRFAAAAARTAKDGPCPTCHQPMKAADVIAHLQKEAEKAAGALQKATKHHDIASSSLTDNLGNDQEAKDTMDAWAGDMGDAETALDEALEAEKKARKAVESLKAEVAALEDRAPPVDLAGKEEDLRRKTENLSMARDLLDKVRTYRTRLEGVSKGTTERERHLREAARYRAMEEALSEDGILSTRSADSVGALREKVEALSAKALPGGDTVSVAVDASLLYNGAPFRECSHGEQFVAAALFAGALASLTGIRFLFLDNLVPVDADQRDRIFGVLMGLVKAGEIDQVFVVTLRDRTGFCPTCGILMVRTAKGCAKCGGPIRLPLPKGEAAKVIRVFEFTGPGQVGEVTA